MVKLPCWSARDRLTIMVTEVETMREQEMATAHSGPLRSLPKNTEAEQVVLGSAILEPEETLPILIDKLRPEDFYRRAHRVIFRTIRDLFDRGEPSDIVWSTSMSSSTG